MSGWWFPVVMLAGRVLSVWLCHAGWRAEEKRGGNFLVWLVLAAWCVAIGGNDWEMFPGSRVWAGVVCALLALEAGGRMGLLAEGKPKILERLLLAGAAAGVWVSPLCVLPCVMISAFLAYTSTLR